MFSICQPNSLWGQVNDQLSTTRMEHKINRPVLFSTLILLIIALSLSDHQKVPSVSSPLTQVNAQSSKTSQSKTNELISSKFRESITQFRRKQQQPIQQQQITKTSQVNEERMIGQNQIVEQHQQEQLNIRQQQRLDQSFEIQQEQQQHSSLDSSESIYGAVKGTPGVDFPNYSTIPNTKFSCDGVPFEPGMYADEATGCQVYHLCYQGRRESFLCGLGTVFNQAILNCDFWYSVECSKSSQHYGLNVEFGKSSSEPVGGNVQSISQSSFSQFQQSQIPIQQQQQQVIKQTYEVVVPSRPSFVRNEDMNIQSFRQTTGKVSPPKQQFASNFVAQSLQASAGGTKSIPPPIIEQARQISTQRKSSSGFLSPGRKAAQLNGVMSMFQQQQFASAESSPMRTFTTGVGTKGSSDASRRGSQRVGSPLIVSSAVVSSDINSKETSYSNSKAPGQFENNIDVGDRVQASGGGNLGSSKQHSTKLIKNTPSLTTGTKTFDQSSAGRDDIDVWKPYFRNRTKTGEKPSAAGTIPAAPVNKGTSSTTPSSNTGENTAQDSGGDASSTPEPASPTLAQPDQEPTFSSEQNTSSSIEPTTTNQDIPSVPKSSVPPPSSSTSTEEPADSESPAVIESGVSSALSTTTPADMNDSSGAPTTTTTAATPTTSITTTTPVTIVTTSDAPSATEPAPTTTTSSAPTTAETPSSSSPETSTTTAQTAPSETTIATPTEPTATVMTTKTQVDDDVSSSATNDKRGAEDDEQNKKKKRGTLTAGVEYAKNGSSTAKPSARANSSSIEYVANMKQGSSSSRTSSS